MIGPKKLSVIRKQIEEALTTSGADPIHRLERRIAANQRKGDPTEVLESLKRFLESSPPRTRGNLAPGRNLECDLVRQMAVVDPIALRRETR